MNRRSFLKLVGAAVAGSCLPVAYKAVNNRHSDFDPRKEYSHGIRAAVWATPQGWATPAGQQLVSRMHAELKCNMEQIVPPAYRKNVTRHERWMNWGTLPVFCWYYNPKKGEAA